MGKDSAKDLISTHPFFPPYPPSGSYLRALNSAAATTAFGFLRERASWGRVS